MLEKLKVRKDGMSYLESVKAFDSWLSGGRSPLNQVVICKVVKDMQSFGFCHSALCPEKNYPSSIPKFTDVQNIA